MQRKSSQQVTLMLSRSARNKRTVDTASASISVSKKARKEANGAEGENQNEVAGPVDLVNGAPIDFISEAHGPVVSTSYVGSEIRADLSTNNLTTTSLSFNIGTDVDEESDDANVEDHANEVRSSDLYLDTVSSCKRKQAVCSTLYRSIATFWILILKKCALSPPPISMCMDVWYAGSTFKEEVARVTRTRTVYTKIITSLSISSLQR